MNDSIKLLVGASAFGLSTLPADFHSWPLAERHSLASAEITRIRELAAAGDARATSFIDEHRLQGQPLRVEALPAAAAASGPCNLFIDEEQGLAWQEDRSQTVPYDVAYYAKYFGYRGTATAQRINAARVGLVRRHLPAGAALIDIGIGSGEFLEAFSAGAGYGCDVNPVAVAWLRSRGQLAEPQRLPTDVGGWTFWDSLEHFPEPAQFLRHVQPGQWLFVSLPTVRSWENLQEWKHYRPNEHLWYWTDDGFAAWLNAQGFEVLERNEEETAAGRLDITSFAARKLDLVLTVPSGIGDTSWVYSKLTDLAATRRIGIRVTADVKYRRAGPFVDLLPGVVNLGYSPHHYSVNYPRAVPPAANLATLSPGEHTLAVNHVLEDGSRIETCWPRQRTDYHYPLQTTRVQAALADAWLAPLAGRPQLGVYCHANGIPQRLGAWSVAQWVDFLAGVLERVPEAGLVFLGAEYDTATTSVYQEGVQRGWPAVSGVGKMHIGTTIETLRRLHYFFSYPSGLAMLADVVDTPCLMWYWPGQHDWFLDTYADPANVSAGRHINRLFGPVAEALEDFERRGLPHVLDATPRRPHVDQPYTPLCADALQTAPSGPALEFGVAAAWNLLPLARQFADRHFIGLDSWQGLQQIGSEDAELRRGAWGPPETGSTFDAVRLQAAPLPNVRLVKGEVPDSLAGLSRVAPTFAWLDMDLYAPTLAAYCWLAERMPAGAILGFHDAGYPETPGIDRVIDQVDPARFERLSSHPDCWTVFFRRR